MDGRYLRDDYPGIGRHVFSLLRPLAELAGGDELVVLHDPGAARTRLDPRELAGPRTTLVAAPIRPRSLREQAALPRLVSRLRLDVFHAPYPFTAWRGPCPRVVSVYDLIALDPRWGLASRAARVAAGAWLRAVTRRAAAVVTPSEAARAALVARGHVRPERVAVTGMAVDPRFAPASPAAVERARRELGLPSRYVLHVSTRRPHKNVARLREAWVRVRQAYPGVALVSAGAHAARGRAPRAADCVDLGSITDEHLPALYTGADLFALPSLDEGFGLPVLEAMACGTPVVCSARGGLREAAGDAAVFVDPEDVEDMAAAVASLLADAGRRRELAERGRRRAGACTPRALAERTWAVYRSAARSVSGALSAKVSP